MKKIFFPILLVILMLSLFGCGASFQPLSPEKKILRQNIAGCIEDANSMIGPKFLYELAWNWYFDLCMKKKGYTPEEAKSMRPWSGNSFGGGNFLQ